MTKKIMNLYSEVIKASGLHVDSRWKRWVKFVDEVDTSQSNGYCFVGSFVNDGTTEVDLSNPKLILVAATKGSRKYQTTYYQVVLLDTEGNLTPIEGLSDDNGERGWALRLRDKVAAELAKLSETETSQANPLANFDTADLIAELKRRGVEVV